MAKGNHVFNDFDGCLLSAFADFLEEAGGGEHLRALGGSGGSEAAAREFMSSRYATSWPLLVEIRSRPQIRDIHWIQDDAVVGASDENSQAFGAASRAFRTAVVAWAWDAQGTNPMEAWRQLVNAGVDKTAWDRFVAGSSIAQAPKSSEGRAARCVELEKFIRGDLTKLAARWLLALRADLTVTVDYKKNAQSWQKTLSNGIGRDWFPPASGAK